MIITEIKELNTKKVLIRLDGHFTFPLYKSELRTYHLTEQGEIDEKVYRELMEELLPKRVRLRAMTLLQKHSFTRAELKRKLLSNAYPEALVEDALDYVTSYHYLDDRRYAEEYIRCYQETRGKRRILQELYRKGIAAELAEAVWEACAEKDMLSDEKTQIRQLLYKKQYDPATATQKDTARMMNYLFRKGYAADDIIQCMHDAAPDAQQTFFE